MSQPNLEIVKQLYNAFASGDIPKILEQMDQSIEWNEAENHLYADRNPYIGPQAILEGVFMRIGAEWDGFTATPDDFLDAGDRIVVVGYYGGSYKATGKAIRAQFAHVWSLRAGKVVQFQQYTDTKQFAEAVNG